MKSIDLKKTIKRRKRLFIIFLIIMVLTYPHYLGMVEKNQHINKDDITLAYLIVGFFELLITIVFFIRFKKSEKKVEILLKEEQNEKRRKHNK